MVKEMDEFFGDSEEQKPPVRRTKTAIDKCEEMYENFVRTLPEIGVELSSDQLATLRESVMRKASVNASTYTRKATIQKIRAFLRSPGHWVAYDKIAEVVGFSASYLYTTFMLQPRAFHLTLGAQTYPGVLLYFDVKNRRIGYVADGCFDDKKEVARLYSEFVFDPSLEV